MPPELTTSLTFDAAEVRAGAALHVYGLGFCAEEGCSPVTIVIDGQTVAQEVSIAADGTFTAEAYVPAITHSGSIPVAAEQTLANGTRLRAFGRLVVSRNRRPVRVFHRVCYNCNDFISNRGTNGPVPFTNPPGVMPAHRRLRNHRRGDGVLLRDRHAITR